MDNPYKFLQVLLELRKQQQKFFWWFSVFPFLWNRIGWKQTTLRINLKKLPRKMPVECAALYKGGRKTVLKSLFPEIFFNYEMKCLSSIILFFFLLFWPQDSAIRYLLHTYYTIICCCFCILQTTGGSVTAHPLSYLTNVAWEVDRK